LADEVKALKCLKDNEWAWDAIDKLNKARNHLAHNLEAPQLEAKVESFIACIEDHNDVTKLTSFDGNLPARLQNAVTWLWQVFGSDLIEGKSERTVST
jgi:hypothetical protein